MFLRNLITTSTENCSEQINRLKNEIENTDAIVIGAGAGMSAAAGFSYSGERFEKYFSDFHKKYGFSDMYSGGFYPYETLEEYWAYWSRYIYINRYMNAPKPVYDKLLSLVKDKDYFVLTTNVDHCFQKAGFDKHRLFYTQGDYGLFQCSEPCCAETFDNEEIIKSMVTAQGYTIDPDGTLVPPEMPKMSTAAVMRMTMMCHGTLEKSVLLISEKNVSGSVLISEPVSAPNALRSTQPTMIHTPLRSSATHSSMEPKHNTMTGRYSRI